MLGETSLGRAQGCISQVLAAPSCASEWLHSQGLHCPCPPVFSFYFRPLISTPQKGTGSRAAHFRAAALLAAECGAPAFSAGLADWVAAAHAAIRAAPWDEDVAPAWRLAATIAARVERSQDSTLGLARAAAPLLSRLAPLAARCLAENGGHPATLCALRALAAVQRALPQSLRQQAGDLRAALGAALTDAVLPRPVWLAVARCWALLPASPGAAADWAAAMQTLLASAHDLLGVLYAGLEAEAAVKEARCGEW